MINAIQKHSEKKDIRTLLKADSVKAQIALALPKHLTPDRMMRVALTAANRNPKLLQCTPESFLGCLMTCSQVGLEPDGRNAHLIPYGDQCTVIFDWKGLVSLARRNGVICTPKLVCQNDTFTVEEDDGTGKSAVHHVIDYTKPRGEIYAVYSRARINEDVDYEIMTRDEVEYVRNNYSRAKDADAWRKAWGEMAKKTVIRRHSKRWPLDPEAAAAFEDEEAVKTPQVNVTRPIFTAPPTAIPEAAPELPEPEPEPTPQAVSEDDGDLGPVTPPAEEKPKGKEPKPIDFLRGVVGLLKFARITEGELLDFLRSTGKIDESLSSLQEVSMVAPASLETVYNEWQSIAGEIKRLKGAKA